VLDSARIQVDALAAALGAASERYANARELVRLSGVLRRIKDGLLDLNPSAHVDVRPLLAALRDARFEDPLPRSALDALLAAMEERDGMTTPASLRVQFERDVRKHVAELAYIPEGKGGMMTALVAKIAAGLRVEGGGGGDDRLAGVGRRVEVGDLLEAAAGLEVVVDGTAAGLEGGSVRGWIGEVRRWGRVVQAVELLEGWIVLGV